MPLTLTPTLARRLAVQAQCLAGARYSPDAQGALAVTQQLGCLQLDPINAVARSPLLVLWSRLGWYDPAVLDGLLWQERRFFEYWAHCAAIVLTEHYPLHAYQMERVRARTGRGDWHRRYYAWLEANAELRAALLAELDANGPLLARQFSARPTVAWQADGWSSGRGVALMLEALWREGVLVVAGRDGTQRVWELAERWLPPWTPREQLGAREVTRRAALQALRALGIARPTHIANHFIRGAYSDLAAVLAELEAEAQIVRVQIADDATQWSGLWYMRADDLPLVQALAGDAWQPRTTLLSPFDNLICDRARTEELWGFAYRTEIYVPKAQRQYGYYVLPVLHGEQLVGRIDPQFDRKARRLQINRVFMEPQVGLNDEIMQALFVAINDLGRFLGAREVVAAEVA